MSPIFVRPVREQLEHDRLIRFLVTRYKRKGEAVANVGDEQIAPIKLGTGTYYPDIVLMEGKKLAGVVEVETAESVNNLEAMAQWVPFSRSRVPFHLYIPVHVYDVARRFCESHQASVTEIWTYRPAADGFDLVRLFHDAGAAARRPAKSLGGPAKALPLNTPVVKADTTPPAKAGRQGDTPAPAKATPKPPAKAGPAAPKPHCEVAGEGGACGAEADYEVAGEGGPAAPKPGRSRGQAGPAKAAPKPPAKSTAKAEPAAPKPPRSPRRRPRQSRPKPPAKAVKARRSRPRRSRLRSRRRRRARRSRLRSRRRRRVSGSAVPFIRFARDKKGYESTCVMHAYRPPSGPQRVRVLYLFRTPAHLKVGRQPLDEEVIEALEHTHPDISFDWTALRKEPAEVRTERPERVERWERNARHRERRGADRPQAPRPPAEPAVIEDTTILGRVWAHPKRPACASAIRRSATGSRAARARRRTGTG